MDDTNEKLEIACQFDPQHTMLVKNGRETKFCLQCAAYTGYPQPRRRLPEEEFELLYDGQAITGGRA